MTRGLYVDFPVLYDPERTKHLQGRVDQGLDTWRTDAAKVVEWEGRMFGFTAEELKAAKVTATGDQATAEVIREGRTYAIQLAREAGKTAAIWTIRGASAK